jgi:hypothetical protein
VREPTEARDDVAMAHREVDEAHEAIAAGRLDVRLGGDIGCELPHQREALLLVIELLAVLERHVEEQSLDRCELAVVPAREAVERQASRLLIRLVGPRIAAMDVAAELVEHDDERDAAACALGPVGELSGFGGGERGSEALADLGVETRVLAPPQCVRAGVVGRKPEFQDGVGGAHTATLANPGRGCKQCGPMAT